MELELKKNTLQCYKQVLETTLSLEETQEAIVPDACPDMARIISVTGQVCLTEKQITDTDLTISGQVETTVLYQSEEGNDLQKISLRLPFQTKMETQTPLDEIFVLPTLQNGEGRMLNPRKVLVRLDIMLELSGFQSSLLSLSYGIEGEKKQTMEQKISTTEIRPLSSVQTKHFTFDESISLQGAGDLDQVLSLRIYPNCTESKLIGNKLIFKGDTDIQIMYLDTEKNLNHSRHSLPFSQIIEIEEVGEGSHATVSIVLENYFANPSYQGARTLDLTLDCMAQATVRDQQHLALLEDTYSTTHQINLEKEEYTLITLAEECTAPQPLRQIFETTMPVHLVEDSWVSTGKVSQIRNDNQITFSCDLSISILCCDESGARNTLTFTQPLNYTTDCNENTVSCCRCKAANDIFTSPVTGGIEVRLTPEFHYTMVEGSAITMVTSATLGEARQRGNASVVLRLPQPEETLWDIAKNYGSTTAQIIQANKIEDTPTLGQMLLIPSIR